jgi:uncharacterized protein (TIGR03000 family)
MIRWLSLLFGSATVAAMLFLTPADAHGPGGGGGHGGYHGGYHGGGFHYGGYYYPHHGYGFYGPYRSGLYAPYGFYRPYYGFGPGLGLGGLGLGMGMGLGLGYGLGSYGMGGYGLGGYGMGGYGMYRPYGGTTIVNPTTVVVAPPGGTGVPPVGGTGVPPVNQTPPPPDNAAHLQLLVPQNAEVLFNGDTTTQTGPSREFVSPPLTVGKAYDYIILVRYPGADGKTVTDRRVIHVRANDWFRIDFTRPAPPEPLPAP